MKVLAIGVPLIEICSGTALNAAAISPCACACVCALGSWTLDAPQLRAERGAVRSVRICTRRPSSAGHFGTWGRVYRGGQPTRAADLFGQAQQVCRTRSARLRPCTAAERPMAEHRPVCRGCPMPRLQLALNKTHPAGKGLTKFTT